MKPLLSWCAFGLAVTQAMMASLPRSTPEAQGISSTDMGALIEALEHRVTEMHSIVVVRNGEVITEGWWSPFAADEPHQMFSLSKSFTSMAVGLAVAEGKLSVDDLVASFFPEELPDAPSANLRAMRVRDLLTMTTGHHEGDFQDFPYASEDAVKEFLALPVAHKPGTYWVYNTPASFMLSAIVQKVSGQPVHEYLRTRLYEPLGIEGATWESNRAGISMGGFGLNARTEDIAKFGQLLLQKGEWRGKQIVPREWIEAATARQTSNGSSPNSDWEQGYGYQFWRCRHGFFRGDGAHGQFCIVLEKFNTVVAITSGTREMASVMNTLWETLVPILENAQPRALPENVAAQAELRAKLAGLRLRTPAGYGLEAAGTSAVGKRFVFPENRLRIEAIAIDAVGSSAPGGTREFALTMTIAGKQQPIRAGLGDWIKGSWPGWEPSAVAAAGAWTSDDTYTMKVVRYHTPFATTFRLRFSGDELLLEAEQNVGPADQRRLQLTGKPVSGPAE